MNPPSPSLEPVYGAATFYKKSLRVLVDGQVVARTRKTATSTTSSRTASASKAAPRKQAFLAKIDISYEEHMCQCACPGELQTTALHDFSDLLDALLPRLADTPLDDAKLHHLLRSLVARFASTPRRSTNAPHVPRRRAQADSKVLRCGSHRDCVSKGATRAAVRRALKQ